MELQVEVGEALLLPHGRFSIFSVYGLYLSHVAFRSSFNTTVVCIWLLCLSLRSSLYFINLVSPSNSTEGNQKHDFCFYGFCWSLSPKWVELKVCVLSSKTRLIFGILFDKQSCFHLCSITVMDVQAFERLLGPCMDIMKRNITHYEEQLVAMFGSSMDLMDPGN